MNTRSEKQPGPDHPISIQHHARRVMVRVAGRMLADTKNALKLQEANYPPVFYIPRADVDMSKLQLTDHMTYCPYKGECTYFSIQSGGAKSVNAVWCYEKPYSSVSKIALHLAFFPACVDSIEEGD